ncbi:MAG: TauD/TfdA family dioxygenase [Rhodospirillales bacterium]|nr:MAG: TauD/TfdA family dioxygenase [Rhodospirillales bacterium]
MDTAIAPAAAGHVVVTPISGNIGAEIAGVHLGRLTDAEFRVVHDALAAYEVLVFRDQDITLDEQMAFGRRFGELSIHPFSPNLDDRREVIVLDYHADNPPRLTDQWHADETFRARPPLGTILRARVVPEHGGDTLFASMTAAYRGLSEPMKRYIHGLEALHDFKPWRTLFTSGEAHQTKLREIEAKYPNQWHPVVRVHPVNGRRILNVSAQFCVRLKGVADDERAGAEIPLRARRHPRVPDARALEAEHRRDVGQPRRPALRRPRLLSRPPHDGARHRRRRRGGRRLRPLHAAGRRAAARRQGRRRRSARQAPDPRVRARRVLRVAAPDATPSAARDLSTAPVSLAAPAMAAESGRPRTSRATGGACPPRGRRRRESFVDRRSIL